MDPAPAPRACDACEPSLAVARRLAIRRVAGHRRQPRTARAQPRPRGQTECWSMSFSSSPHTRADDTAACTWLHRIGTYGTLASGPTVRLGCTMAY